MLQKKYNLVIFNPDQCRANAIGHLGAQGAVTPVLDAFAETEAVSFRNAFCQNPVCVPSRCSFMSGWYPHVKGHRTMYYLMHQEDPTLLKRLKEDGYYVIWAGKNDLIAGDVGYRDVCDYKANLPKDGSVQDFSKEQSWRGAKDDSRFYSFFAGVVEQADDLNDSDAIFLQQSIAQINALDAAQPFCLYMPCQYPHPPYGVSRAFRDKIDARLLEKRIVFDGDWSTKPSVLKKILEKQNLDLFDEETWCELRAVYYAMCARVDAQFGQLLEALKNKGVYDDTLIVFLSDHGDFTGDYGLVEKTQNTFEDCIVNVPFLIKPPKDYAVQPGIRDGLVELIDLVPLVEEICGLKKTYDHFGKSPIPFFDNPLYENRTFAFCEGGRLSHEMHCSEMQSPSAKEGGLYYPRISVEMEDPIAHTKACMMRTKTDKYVYRLYEQDEFYDLQNDPKECNNQINNPQYAAQITQMKAMLLDFMVETTDVVPYTADARFFPDER